MRSFRFLLCSLIVTTGACGGDETDVSTSDSSQEALSCGRLNPGEQLNDGEESGESVSSCNGRYTLRIGTSYVVLSSGGILGEGFATLTWRDGGTTLWSEAGSMCCYGATGAYAVMQQDGNFVFYSSGGYPYFATNTAGNSGAYLALQDDGNLVVYSESGTPLWASNTAQ